MIAKTVRHSTKSSLISVSALGQLGSVPRAWLPILIYALLAVVCAASAPLSAQTAYFSGTVVSPLPSIASDGPAGVAIDATGNIFFADFFSGCSPNCKVFEIPFSGGTYGTPTAIGTFDQPIGVAVDGSDDVFVADYYVRQVYELKPSGPGTWNAPTALYSGTFNTPLGVAVDAAGDLFVVDYAGDAGTSQAYKITFSGGSPSSITAIGAPFSHGAGVAVDNAGNVYVADNVNSAVYVIPPGSSSNTQIGSGFTHPNLVAVDAIGNVYVTDGGVTPTLKEIVASNGKAAGSTTILTLNDSGITTPYGVAVDGNGNLFVSDSNSSSYAIKEIMLGGVNFGSTAVATSSPLSETLQFDVTVGGTMSAPAVLTNGAASSDFSLGSTTCSGSVSAGTCTVTVNFTPRASGTRAGAVELLNSGGTAIIATAQVNGTGTGPQITFGPGVPTNLAKSTTFHFPEGVAVDGSGNVYVADPGAPAVYKIPSGSATATALGSGFSNPSGVAVDGNGDVFVADPTGGVIKEILAVNGSIPATPTIVSVGGFFEGGATFTFSNPGGTAVDRAGNVYVADTNINAIQEILAASGYSVVTTLKSGFSSPKSVAVDSSGNVYVADTGHNAVKEIVAVNGHVTSSSTTSTLGGGFTFHSPQSVAVDSNGNVYIGDDVGLFEIPFGTSTVSTLVSGLSTASGVAVDARGNVYYSNSGFTRVSELPLATAPALTFSLQGDGSTSAAQSVTILNDGNSATPLAAVSPGIALSSTPANNYTLGSSSGDCTTTFSLSPGQSCNISVKFTPVAPASGTVPGTVTLTDNNLNASPSTTQQISLTGTALDITISSPATLPDATFNSPYSEGPFTASPSSTYTWSATGLPTGLTMSSGGTLSGTPTQSGTFSSVVVTATDSGNGFTGSSTYTLTVDKATPVLSVTNSPVPYNGSPQSATVSSGGISGTVSNIEYNGSSTIPTNLGTYAITANFTSTDPNYTNLTGASAGNFVIGQATPVLSVTNSPVTYNGSPQSATLTATVTGIGNVPGVFSSVKYSGSGTVPTNAATYAMTATFTPTDTTNYKTVTAASAGSFVINQATPVLSVTNSPVPYSGSPQSATVSSGGVSGTVSNIKYNGSSTIPTNLGTYAITANFTSTDPNYTNLTGASAGNFVIGQATPTLGINCTPNPVSYQQQLTCSATVSGDHGGTIALTINGNPWASGAPNGSGTFSATRTVQVSSGTYTVAANYSGDTNYTATSTSTNVTAQPATPTLGINCTPNPVGDGQQLTCSATVSGDFGGTIALTINGNPWASGAPNGSGTFSATRTVQVSSGTYTVAANYSGDTNYTATSTSTNVTAQKGTPTLGINCTPNPVGDGQQLTCSATVSGDHGGTIALTINGNPWASGAPDGTGTFSATRTVQVSSGTYTVGANYSGDTNYTATSTSTNVTAQKGTPTLGINCTPNPVGYQQQLTCSATVSGDFGGTIALTINGNPWASGAPNGSGTFSATRTVQVSSGTYTVAANYSGDTNYTATSTSTNVTAQPATPTLGINCTPNPVSYQQQLTCSATVSGDHGGTIALTINGNPWASGAPDGTGTFSATRTVQVSSGTYTVAANYSGDTNYTATSTSTNVTAQP